MKTTVSPAPRPSTLPASTTPAGTSPVPSAELGEYLDQVQREEQEKIDRQRADALAKIRELSRFD